MSSIRDNNNRNELSEQGSSTELSQVEARRSVPRNLIYDPQNSYFRKLNTSDKLNILDLLDIFFKRKFLILSMLLLGAILSTLVAFKSTPMYRATSKIEVQKQENTIVEGSVEPTIIADIEFMQTQYALLKSRSLAERVVQTLNLQNQGDFVSMEDTPDVRLYNATERLLKKLDVSPEGRGRVINVQFADSSADRSASVANTLVDTYIETTMQRKFNTTSYARDFLADRLAQAKQSLEETEKKLIQYAEDNDILEFSEAGQETNLTNDTLLALNSELSEARTERIIAEQNLITLKNSPDTEATLINKDLTRLRSLRSDLETEYQELFSIYKPDFPQLKTLKSRIDAIDEELARGRTAIIDAAQATFNAAKKRESILERDVNILKSELRSLRARKVDYTILKREVDTARSQYDGLLQRLKEVSIAAGIGSSQISVVDRAIVPNKPFAPKIPLIIALGLVMGGALGGGLAFLLHLLDNTIKSPEDIKNELHLPTLGVIPMVKHKEGDKDIILTELKDPKSQISEAYFTTRTSLEYASEEGVPKSLSVTSTKPSEGKSSTTLAIAISFAKIGRKVLIIDADLRKPSFVSATEDSLGLSGLLTRQAPLEDNLIYSEQYGIHLLPSGVIPPNPAELLSGGRLKEIITEAEGMFDLVMVDSPPLLNFADGPVLAAHCRGTIVVYKSRNVHVKAAKRTVERLVENGVNVLGAILTQFDAKQTGYDYNYHYYAYGEAGSQYGSKGKSISQASRSKIRLFDSDTPS